MTAAAMPNTGAPPVPRAGRAQRVPPRDLILAAVLTAVLFIGWTAQNWLALSHMRLPDNDDMMRIAQVRDWIAGQDFRDLLQHRLGPPGGASMHWSRLGDVGPAALLVVLTPILGTHAAEVAAVIAYQAILFFLYLLLAGRIAARLYGPEVRATALILAALAFPTVTLFLPGRIDHHAIQIVLTLVLVETLVAPPSVRRGVAGGLAVAASLAIGLETAPEIVAAMAGFGLLWAWGGREENARACALGTSLAGATALWYLVAKPAVWPEEWCDGFTPSTVRATAILSAAFILLGAAGVRAAGWRNRLVLGGVIGGIAGVLAWRLSPSCFGGPYGALTPFLQRYWMSNVTEAKGVFDAIDTVGVRVSYVALSVGGTALALAHLVRRPFEWKWAAFALFLVLSTVAAFLQIRVTYVLAGIAVLPFAGVIVSARAAGRTAVVLAAWAAGAGVLWNAAARQHDLLFAREVEAARVEARACTSVATIADIRRLPPGTVMAPIDLGSYIIGMTAHRAISAGYHRNNAGNMASYMTFLSPPARAERIVRASGADYLAICPSNMQEENIQRFRKGSLLEQLQDMPRPPAWLERLPSGSGLLLYRVRPPA
jgi:hypothetical protein